MFSTAKRAVSLAVRDDALSDGFTDSRETFKFLGGSAVDIH